MTAIAIPAISKLAVDVLTPDADGRPSYSPSARTKLLRAYHALPTDEALFVVLDQFRQIALKLGREFDAVEPAKLLLALVQHGLERLKALDSSRRERGEALARSRAAAFAAFAGERIMPAPEANGAGARAGPLARFVLNPRSQT